MKQMKDDWKEMKARVSRKVISGNSREFLPTGFRKEVREEKGKK